MRIADAQIALEGFPEQAYDFTDSGIQSFVAENREPEQLDAAATMLIASPLTLLRRLFRATSPALQKLLKMAQSTVIAQIKLIAGGTVAAVASQIVAVLTGLLNWANKQ
jgi:hypothetical protein